MACTAGPRKVIGDRVQQRRQRLPIAAKPGEQSHTEQKKDGTRGQSILWPPQNVKTLSAQIPEPEGERSGSEREEVKNRGLLASEQKKDGTRGQSILWPPQNVKTLSAQIPEPEGERSGSEREEVKNRGLLASE